MGSRGAAQPNACAPLIGIAQDYGFLGKEELEELDEEGLEWEAEKALDYLNRVMPARVVVLWDAGDLMCVDTQECAL